MAKADALFLLIKSLSPSEKALVRQGDKAQPGYLALFDFMSRQSDYDERKAKKKLLQLGHEINFAYAKNYLTRHILRVLREHEDAGQLAGTRQLQEIELLMRRRVYELAEKLLLKAREKALSEERWHDFLQLSQTEMALLTESGGDLAESIAQIDRLNSERAHARAMLLNLGEYEDLYHRYRPVLKRKQNARNELDVALVDQFAKHHLLSSRSLALSVRARRIHDMCQSMIQSYLGNYEGARKALQDNIALYEAHGFLREDYPEGYLNDLWRLGGHHLYAGKHAEVEQTLATLKQARERHDLHNADIFEKYTRLLLSYALTTKQYALVEAELGQIHEGLAAFADSIPWTSQSALLLLLGRLHLERGRHREAKALLNQILDHPARNQREDMTSLARIMLIFIYWEQGESDLAESSSRATRKYLQRRDALYQFERRILRFLEQHSFHDEGPSLLKALQTLHADLTGIFADPLEANILAYFDIMGWLDSKIKGLKG